MGNWIEVSIVAMPDVVHFNQVYLNAFQPNEDNDGAFYEFIRMCLAVKKCAEELRQEYSAISESSTALDYNHQYHLPRVALSETCGFDLKFLSKLDRAGYVDTLKKEYDSFRYELDENRRQSLFLARKLNRDCYGRPHDVVVKFTSKYARHAHELMSQNGFAPSLYGCIDMWEDRNGKMMMIVMDRVPGTPLRYQPPHSLPSEFFDKIKQAINILHSNNYVFGDLRSINIMVDSSWGEPRPILVDYDWVGEENKDLYPPSLNMMLVEGAFDQEPELSQSVARLGKMKQEHDLEALEILRKKYEQYG